MFSSEILYLPDSTCAMSARMYIPSMECFPLGGKNAAVLDINNSGESS